MMKKMFGLCFLVLLFLCISSRQAMALVYLEDFEAAFPAWESGWLGLNSNLTNYYGVGADRGNNPDGLWIEDGDGIHGTNSTIVFNPSFGSTLTGFGIDVAGWTPARLQVFDMSNVLLLDTQIALTQGAWSDPGVYAHYSTTSDNGISKFAFVGTSGGQVEGNTGIDNVTVSDGLQEREGVVPEPASMILWGIGLAGAALRKRSRRA
jgi:hypothetical protein